MRRCSSRCNGAWIETLRKCRSAGKRPNTRSEHSRPGWGHPLPHAHPRARQYRDEPSRDGFLYRANDENHGNRTADRSDANLNDRPVTFAPRSYAGVCAIPAPKNLNAASPRSEPATYHTVSARTGRSRQERRPAKAVIHQPSPCPWCAILVARPACYMGLEVGGGSIVTVTRAKRPSAGPPFTRSNATVKVRGPRCTDVAGLLIIGMNRVRTVCPSINLTTCGCIRS